MLIEINLIADSIYAISDYCNDRCTDYITLQSNAMFNFVRMTICPIGCFPFAIRYNTSIQEAAKPKFTLSMFYNQYLLNITIDF